MPREQRFRGTFGSPMPTSTGKDIQPYKYNGNEYDTNTSFITK